MDAHQKYHWCIHVALRILFKITFRDVFAERPRLTAANYVVIGFFLSVLFGGCYTILFYRNLTAFLSIVAVFALTQALFKYMFVNDTQMLLEIADFIEDIYKQNAKPRGQNVYYSNLCEKYADRSIVILKVVVCGFAGMHCCFVSALFLDNWLKGVMAPIFRIYLPGLDEHTLFGAIFLNIFNYVVILVADLIIPPFDSLIYIIFANMPMVASVITGHLDELRKALLHAYYRKTRDINNRLIQIIFMHKKYKENVQKLDKAFFKSCFCQIVTSSVFTLLSIFMARVGNYLPAHLVVIYGLFQIITYFILGTIIEIASNRIYDAIKSFEWYLLPSSQLKTYQMLLHHSQQPTIIYIAGVRELNMESSVSLLKGLYTYAMLLYSSVF